MRGGAIVMARLTGNVAVAAIVADRVKPVNVPEGVDLPACAYLVQIMDAVDGTAPLQRGRVTIHCLAHDDSTADSLAVAADTALNGYAARDGSTTLTALQRVGWDDFRDEEANIWGRTLTYDTWILY